MDCCGLIDDECDDDGILENHEDRLRQAKVESDARCLPRWHGEPLLVALSDRFSAVTALRGFQQATRENYDLGRVIVDGELRRKRVDTDEGAYAHGLEFNARKSHSAPRVR